MIDVTIREIQEKTGLKKSGASKRLARYLDGQITREQLFSPPGEMRTGLYNSLGLPTPHRLAAITGTSLNRAYKRIQKYLRGEATREQMFARSGEYGYRSIRPTQEWINLKLTHRLDPDDIPGPTRLENMILRRNRWYDEQI